MLTVSLDTNIFPIDDLIALSQGLEIEFARASQVDYESEKMFDWGQHPPSSLGKPSPIEFTLGVSRLGYDVLASNDSKFVAIFKIISNGSLPPKPGSDLTPGQINQVRDARILNAHAIAKRQIFVTKDQKAFIKHGKREKLEQLLQTKIMTRDKFVDYLNELKLKPSEDVYGSHTGIGRQQ